jgi:hypothetical protein
MSSNCSRAQRDIQGGDGCRPNSDKIYFIDR